MQARLRDRFAQYEARFFRDSASMIDWLRQHLPQTLAIALDHDLELVADDSGHMTDPGTGREVAEFLAQQSPQCRVMIHSSNAVAAVGMETVLQDAGWTTSRVVPYDDLAWIGDWFLALRKAIVDHAHTCSPAL